MIREKHWWNKPKGGEGGNGTETGPSVPVSALKGIKDKARAAGKREALTEMDAMARAAGFKSHADFVVKTARAAVTADDDDETPPPKRGSGGGRGQRRDGSAEADRRIAEAEERIQRDRALLELEGTAIRQGIDPEHADYAVAALSKHVTKLSRDEATKLDAGSWFASLRAKNPHLFITAAVAPAGDDVAVADKVLAERGATTTSGGGKDAPPKTETKPKTSEPGPDAMADDATWEAFKRQYGI